MDALLGVERSLLGRRWILRRADEERIAAIARSAAVSDILARTLELRGVSPDEAKAHLSPSLSELMPDPHVLVDMEAATELVADAVESGEKIGIFSDYDVDGATSAATASRFLSAIGAEHEVYIPDRFKEGYGISREGLETLESLGARTILTLDCGTIDPLGLLGSARDRGMRAAVIDHHRVDESEKPDAEAHVNPHRMDDSSGLDYLCAAGLTFMLVASLNRSLRSRGFYERKGLSEPNLKPLLDCVALGTICDVMPLRKLNRAFLARGAEAFSSGSGSLGLRALASRAGAEGRRFDAYLAGFVLGPRLNAAGRLDSAMRSFELLTARDSLDASRLSERLESLNSRRREIEDGVVMRALESLGKARDSEAVIVWGDGWHRGVVGVAAGRLSRARGVPAIVIGFDDPDDSDKGVGSCRSPSGCRIGFHIVEAHRAGLLEAGGGHDAAAGLTIRRSRLDDFVSFIGPRLRCVSSSSSDSETSFDGLLTAGAATPDLALELESGGPYGMGNRAPLFAFADHVVEWADRTRDGRHVRCRLVSPDGGGAKGILFRAGDGPLGERLLSCRGDRLHVAARVSLNEWNGRVGADLQIEDLAESV